MKTYLTLIYIDCSMFTHIISIISCINITFIMLYHWIMIILSHTTYIYFFTSMSFINFFLGISPELHPHAQVLLESLRMTHRSKTRPTYTSIFIGSFSFVVYIFLACICCMLSFFILSMWLDISCIFIILLVYCSLLILYLDSS